MSFLGLVGIVLVVNYVIGPIIWRLFIEPRYHRKPPQQPPLPRRRRLRGGTRLLFYGCVIVLIFATVFGFIPLLPWAGDCGLLLFLWWGRLSGHWPQASVEPVLRDPHDLLEGDCMLLARFRVERGDPGGRAAAPPPGGRTPLGQGLSLGRDAPTARRRSIWTDCDRRRLSGLCASCKLAQSRSNRRLTDSIFSGPASEIRGA
jgi:hypothetical protein